MKNEEILSLLHRLMGLTRRSAPHPHPPALPRHEWTPELARSFRERGRILIHLEKESGVTQKRLAELLEIRPQSLSELLTKLENDGMIERTANQQDKREMLVSLSPCGRARLDAIKTERERFATEFLSPLSEEEKTKLAELLTKLIEAKKESAHPGEI